MQNVIAILMAGAPGEREPSSMMWPFLLIMAGVLIVILYLFYQSKPPSGPKIGE